MVKDHLINVCKLPPDKVERLFDSFRQTLATYVADAERAVNEKDAPSLRLAAHSLKGGLLNMGLNHWAELAYRLECDAKAGEVTSRHHDLIQEMHEGIAPLFSD